MNSKKARTSKSSQKPLKIAMIAPPWLAMPIEGYGGIELVVQGIVEELAKRDDVIVEVFANGKRSLPNVKTHSFYKEELFESIDYPYYDAPLQIMQAHLNYSLKKIEEAGDFDIIHDHNPYIGPSFFSPVSRIPGLPPVLHTFHGPPFSDEGSIAGGQADNRDQLKFMDPGRLFSVCISNAMAKKAPKEISKHMLKEVHNAIDYEKFPFVEKKKGYYITLARFTADKGQVVAAEFATKFKKRLRMAGTVAGMSTNQRVLVEMANPLSKHRHNEEYKYFHKHILPYLVKGSRITYPGNLSGDAKMKFISEAKALLFPIQWEEPFGMAVIEAMACGTPVVAMRRGSMPELIEHGVNGFLANNKKEFFEYANRVDEINPSDCRRIVIERFSSTAMAESYLDRYREVIALAG